MRLIVDVLHKQITAVTPSPGVGISDKTESYPIAALPPTLERDVVRIGWDDAEMHHVEGGEATPGKGAIVRTGAQPNELVTEFFSDRALIEPFIAILEAARTTAANEAAGRSVAQAAQTAAPHLAASGYTR